MATKTKTSPKSSTKKKAAARKKPAAVLVVEAVDGGGFVWRALDADGKEVEIMNGVSRSRHYARRAGATAYPHLPVQ
jgi:hypothetical protein